MAAILRRKRFFLETMSIRMLVRNFVAGLAIGLAFFVAGCKKAAGPGAAPVPEVVVVDVVQRDVPVVSEWVGTTEGFVNAEIHPKISGYLLKQNYRDGEQVHSGQLLFQIDDREYKAAYDQAIGDLGQKQADYKKNKQDLDKYIPLYQQQVISKQDFDHVNQSTRSSAAAVASAQAAVESAKLNLQWTQVNSPIDGIAGIAPTQVGNLVTPTSVLTTVSQVDPIKVEFPISEREYLHFADRISHHEKYGDQKSDPDLDMVLADGSTYKYKGRFYVANRQVNIQTGTINIQGIFPNPDAILRPGLYAKVRSAADVRKGALLVPQAAVLETQGQYQVAVVGADNKVTMRTVTTGKKVGDDLRIIEQGVSPGERVITEGLQKVQDGSEVKPRQAPPEPSPAISGAPGSSAPASAANPGS